MIEVKLKDGRTFRGFMVLSTRDTLDLTWTDRGVNHQVCIPKDLIDGEIRGQAG